MEPPRHPLRGAGWTILSFAITKVVALAATVVLARLLEPDDFGILALALVVVVTTSIVSQLGLWGAVVLAEEESETLRTTLALLLLGGAGGMALVALAAPTLAELFNSPDLEPVLQVLSVLLLVGALTSFYEALIQRKLQFRSLFRAQLVQGVVFAIVAIALAELGAGVWSLVAGQLAASVSYSIALVAAAPYRVRPELISSRVASSLRPGRGFMVQRLLVHTQHNVDVGAIGYVSGSRAAGFYSLAYRLADLPYLAFTEPVAVAGFPALAAKHRKGETISHTALELLAIVAFFACPAGLLLSATAAPLIQSIFGTKWQPAVAPLAVLGIWSALAQVNAALGWVLNATGRAGANAAIFGAVTIPLVPALVLAAEAGGITGVAWVMLAGAAVTGGALMLYVHHSLAIRVHDQLATLAGVAAAGAATWASARLAVEALTSAADALALLVGLIVGAASYVVVVWILAPATLRGGITFLHEAIASVRSGEREITPRHEAGTL
jgi:lipopolysaccharide exporter